MKKKKIEREQNHFFSEYAPVIKAVVVLIILALLLTGVILFKPVRKEDVKDPSVLNPVEKNINTNDATCDGEKAPKIKEDAAKVEIAYEVVDDYFFGYMAESDDDLNGNGIIDTDPVVENLGYALKMKLKNMTENIKVVITNDIDDTTRSLSNKDVDSNGLITWFEDENTVTRIYTVKVYSGRDECPTALYREFQVQLPKYNQLERSLDCDFEPAKDLELCQPFIFSDKTLREDTLEFRRQIKNINEKKQADKKAEEENKKENIIDKAIDYAKKNYVVVALAGVALIFVVSLIIIKKRGK